MRRGVFVSVLVLASVLTVSASENSASLIDAIKAGNSQTVRTLLKQRPDVNEIGRAHV